MPNLMNEQYSWHPWCGCYSICDKDGTLVARGICKQHSENSIHRTTENGFSSITQQNGETTQSIKENT